jgi:sigma-B regulation protein RsbU (phosphoserine phosphatase)
VGFRLKTSILIIASVILAVAPFTAFSLEEFTQTSLERERRSFRAAAAALAEEIGYANYTYLSEEVVDIVGRKEALRKVGLLYAGYLDALGEGGAGLPEAPGTAGLRGALARLGVEAGVVRLGGPGPGEPAPGLPAAWDGVRDVLGRTIPYLVREDDQAPEGRFYLFTSGEGKQARARLGFLCPSADRERIYAFLDDITLEAARADRAAEAVMEHLGSLAIELPVADDALAAVYGGDGKPLLVFGGPAAGAAAQAAGQAGSGPWRPAAGSPEAWRALTLPESLRERVRAEGFVEGTGELAGLPGRMFYRVERFKALDWYIALVVPASALAAPGRALAWRLALAAAAAAALGVVFALVSAGMISKGLLRLERRAREAEALDLGDPRSAGFFREDPLSRRKDEVGRLAQAMDRLGLSLVANIQEAVSAGKARERVLGELNAARVIQAGMLPLPKEAPKSPGFDAAAFLRPAMEVGGDLYDFFTAPCGRRCLAIGDVSDKGVPAALFMSMVVTLVRVTIQSGLQPEEALERLNEQLNDRNPGSMFVTIFIGLFDASDGTLTYANGGHNPPAVAGAGGARLFSSEDPDPLVGAWPGIRYKRRQERLEDGELCLLYTDGVTEAQDAAGALFGQERLLEALQAAPREPEEAVEAVYRSTLRWRGDAPQSDDITMLAFRRKIP